MNIAELFVNLGFKGADSAGKALKNVKSGLGEVKSMSLEAKAAIIGVVYGLERLMSDSAKQGTALSNFNALTGLSTQRLQEWQYAARQVGVASEELTGSVRGVQQSMTDMLLGKGAPEGLAMVANQVGFDAEKARDTFYVMQQLQKFAQQVPPDVGARMIRSFGVSDNVIAAMQKNAFRPEIFSQAPKFSEGQINQLNKVDAAWSNLGQKIKMAFGHFTSSHGMKLVSDLSKITTEVIKMINAFVKLADMLKVFSLIGKAFEGWGMIFSGIGEVVGKIKDFAGSETKSEDVVQGSKNFYTTAKDVIGDMMSHNDMKFKADQKDLLNRLQQNKNQNVNINNTLNFQHDGKDHKKTEGSVKKAIQDSYRQMSAQSQGT